jgi:hypothetical protein
MGPDRGILREGNGLLNSLSDLLIDDFRIL